MFVCVCVCVCLRAPLTEKDSATMKEGEKERR